MNSREEFFSRLGRPMGNLSLSIRRQDVLRDKKWKIFLKSAKKFKFIPFVDFVFASGSMVLGNVREASDFDVLVGCRYGRIFTARFFCILLFGILNERRKKLSHDDEAKNKICFNHFITAKSLRLSGPHHIYWRELYRSLVPIYGDSGHIEKFWEANDWTNGHSRLIGDTRRYSGKAVLGQVLEFILAGLVGDILESFLRKIQLRRIKKSLLIESGGFEPRIKYTDEELEFHPDQKVYKMMLDLG